MAKGNVFRSTYPGKLVLADGTEIPSGGRARLSDADLKNEGIADFINRGWLVDDSAAAEAKAKAEAEAEAEAKAKAEAEAEAKAKAEGK